MQHKNRTINFELCYFHHSNLTRMQETVKDQIHYTKMMLVA